MTQSLETPLNDDELVELDEFLLSADEGDDDRLTVDEAHGYISSFAVKGGDAFSTDAWIRDVWGQPEFESDEQRERLSGYMVRMRNDILTMLKDGRSFEPLIAELEEEDGELLTSYEGWCFGFMLAVSKAEESWGDLEKNEEDLLVPIAKLAMLYVEEDSDMDDDEYETMVDLIPGSVIGLYQYWQSKLQ